MTVLLLLVALLTPSVGWAEEWNRFRGPNGTGVSDATGLPVEFGSEKNLVWRTIVPFGRSSPILTADRVVVTGSEGRKLVTVCLDGKAGKVIWQREVLRDRTQKVYQGNDSATPTPVSDGKNFYVFFPDFGLVSYSEGGKERWQLKLGPFNSFYGVSASPIVHGNTLVQVCDQKRGSFLIAVDKDTGHVRWRKERYKDRDGLTDGYSTPVVWTPEKGKPQIIISGSYRIDAYAIDTGENIWWVGNQGTYVIATPALADGVVYAISQGSDKPPFDPWDKWSARLDVNKDGKISPEELLGDKTWATHFGDVDRNDDGFVTADEWEMMLREYVSEHGLVAVRAGGVGDQTKGHVIWRYKKDYSYVPSPLLYQDVLYMLKNGGVVTSLNPVTVEVFKTARSKDAIENYFSSPVAADGKVYLIGGEGKVSVLKAGKQWEVLAVNDLGEDCQATPAIGNGCIFIRTAKALYCFGLHR